MGCRVMDRRLKMYRKFDIECAEAAVKLGSVMYRPVLDRQMINLMVKPWRKIRRALKGFSVRSQFRDDQSATAVETRIPSFIQGVGFACDIGQPDIQWRFSAVHGLVR